ncbi:hypothetical protein BH10ACI2_BH10ACI2_14560 [soil metagenome]
MIYRLRFESRSLKDIKKLENSDKRRVIHGIEKLTVGLVGDVKKLTAFKPRYRLRLGNFRVLFDLESDEIVVHRIKDRRDAY